MDTPLRADSLAESPALDAAVGALLDAAHAGVFLDFDGTLSPLQDDPRTVLPAPGVVGELDRLAERLDRVAVVSGRNAAFLRDKLLGDERRTSSKIEVYGLYGLEHLDAAGEVRVVPEVAQWIPVIAELGERAGRELPAGVYVEDKHVSMALHYRTAQQARAAVESWGAAAAARTGLVVQPGRMVIELRPPIERDKGDVITALLAGLDAAWYLGDDVADLPAFAALSNAGDLFTWMRIAVANDTGGAELSGHADLLLASPAVVTELLALLNARAAQRSG